MAKTCIGILFTWTLLQAVGGCDSADTCVAVRPCDNAKNIGSLESRFQAALDSQVKQNASLVFQSDLLAQLSTLEMRLNATERHNAALLAQLSTLEVRLNATERQNADLASKVTTQLRDTEAQLTTFKRDVSVNVSASQTKMEEGLSMMDKSLTKIHADLHALTRQNADLTSKVTTQQRETKTQLTTFNRDLGNLKRDVGPKVGFSAVLASGRFTGARETVVFKHVIINNGNAYNPTTGEFTAPQKGAYHFTFTIMGLASYYSGAKLVKNGQLQVSTYRKPSKDNYDSTAGAATLSLNAGDIVKILTYGGRFLVYGDGDKCTTFSGFLLFPL